MTETKARESSPMAESSTADQNLYSTEWDPDRIPGA